MAKVFIINKGSHDYSDAQRYGEIVYITEGSVNKFDVSQMFRECDSALASSEADDYILLTSLTTLCSVACAIFGRKHGRLNLLLFKDDRYVERRLVLNGSADPIVRTKRKLS